MISQKEKASFFLDDVSHQSERAGAVGTVIDQVAQLDDEAIGCGGVAERIQITMHVSYDANASTGDTVL
jgi:NADPH-dependent curcumin reductase CurA